MNPEQQRIAIAEACGWKGISPSYLIGYAPWRPEAYSARVNACPLDELECIPLDPLPDYLSNLNAMHDALAKLPRSLRGAFNDNLAKRVGGKMCEVANDDDMLFQFATATAAQSAEAFLRTLGLWKE